MRRSACADAAASVARAITEARRATTQRARGAALLAACATLAACQALAPAPTAAPETPPRGAAYTASPARAAATDADASPLSLRYIGRQVLPHRFRFGGTTVGGLSGIDYDPATRRYWAISDDRSEYEPARFYELSLDLDRFDRYAEPGHAGIVFHAVHTLRRPDGSEFASVRVDPARATDPESIRVHAPTGRLVWSSEGERIVAPGRPPVLADPHIWEIDRAGAFVRALRLPEKFRTSATERGVRRNLAFEGLAFTPDFRTLFAATENALLQDGPVATATASSPSRVIAYDWATGAPKAEYVIDVSPIPVASRVPGGFADNGISEILALADDRLLVLERSYAEGAGNTIRLFDASLRGATDVSQFDSLAGRAYAPAAKRLVLDLATLGIRLDNLEGMTWGPRLADGRRSLVLVADDNFSPGQITLFLAFALDERE